jgi:hypothetical protein
MRTWLIFLGACALVPTGCPADQADDGGNGSEGSDSGEGTGTSAGTSGASQSETSAATGDPSSTSASTGETQADDGTSGEGSSGSGGDGDSTGASDPCVGLSREECQADDACMPLVCSPYEMTGDAMWCVAGPEFVGCQSAEIGCDDVRVLACMGDDAPVYRCPSSCIPAGWSECAPPVEGDVPMCP